MGAIALRSDGKKRGPIKARATHSLDLGRREFLVRSCQSAAVATFSSSLCRLAFSSSASDSSLLASSPADFHLRPHYRSQRPLDALLRKVDPAEDDFPSERYHALLASMLAEWTAALLESPQAKPAFEKVLAEDFLGSSLLPLQSRTVRAGPVLTVEHIQFSAVLDLPPHSFSRSWMSALACFTKFLTAQFQITRITADMPVPGVGGLPTSLKTRVRYEFVGEGAGVHREQRIGDWDIDWVAASTGPFRLRRWLSLGETRCRSSAPVFMDIAAQALGRNPSYSAQLLHGVDHWRTVLDGACGIDVYGHAGVSLADIDNDGLDDLYICQPAGLPNRLYRNRGDGTFEDVTEASGLGLLDNTSCALFADFDNAGLQDAIVVCARGPKFFRNLGDGKFRYQPDAFRFANPPQGTFTGAAVADYDRDGWLDIYFCLYAFYQGTDQYRYPVPYHAAENGPPNFLMRNQHDGTFRDVTAESGLNQNNTRYSFCCGWADYNGDGWPDLYVVNDFGRKNLYRNNGEGTFTDVAQSVGAEDVGAGMSVCWLDYDLDCAPDLYVGNMWTAAGERIAQQERFKRTSDPPVRALYRKHAMGNSLLRNSLANNGETVFQDRTSLAGVGMGRWAWSSDAFDFDHDGYPDLYIANGMISGASEPDLNSFFWRQVVEKSPDSPQSSPDYEQGWSAMNELIRADGTWSGRERNVLYANNRDGTFSDVSGAVDLDFIEDGRSFALADFDQDGRLEIFLKNRDGPQLRVLQNTIRSLPPSMAFRLRGTNSNRDAIGAEVTVYTAAGKQTRRLQAGSGFLSQHSKELLFGLGETQGPLRATIRWPNGHDQELNNLPRNHRIWVEEGSERLRMERFKDSPPVNAQPTLASPDSETPAATAQTWLLSPLAAPEISLPDLSGQMRSLSNLQGKLVLLSFWTPQSQLCRRQLQLWERVDARWATLGLHLLAVTVDDPGDRERSTPAQKRNSKFPILRATDDVAGIYNLLHRHLFDRHRDLALPASFLIDERGEIVKLYRGLMNPEQVEKDIRQIPRTLAQRLACALPFTGVSQTFEFGRNQLSLGSVFFQRGYFDQAEQFFRLAVSDNPASAEAYYGLGSARLGQGKAGAARANFEKSIRLPAAYPETLANAWNNLGLLATQEGRTDEAIRSFQEALLASPDHLVALDNLGNAYRLQKNWTEARKTFDRALAVNSADPEANYGLAMVFAQSDDSESAYEYLQKALKVRPGYPEALNNLGILYLRTGRRDRAVATFQECIGAAPGFEPAYMNLARFYALEGSPEKARSVLRALLRQHPDHAAAQSMLEQLGR